MKDFAGTCSISDLKDDHPTFARDVKYLEPLKHTGKRVTVIIPIGLDVAPWQFPENVSFYRSQHVDYEFAVMHNRIYEGVAPDENKYHSSASVHPSIQVGEGIHVSIGPEGKRVQMRHMGNFVVGKNSIVGPLVFVERACMKGQSTVVEENSYLDGFCMIAHQSRIKSNSMVATGSLVCASSVVGENCKVGVGTTIIPHVSICDNVVIGAGSLVTKDITESGVYFGRPVTRKRDFDPNWMW